MVSTSVLEIRVLGELEVWREGWRVTLPASKRTRALLGYLVATGRPHLRSHLCDLLWLTPDDPRAALRWSLAKLRPLLEAGSLRALIADRERVGFDSAGVEVDWAAVKRELGAGVASAPTDALRRGGSWRRLCGTLRPPKRSAFVPAGPSPASRKPCRSRFQR